MALPLLIWVGSSLVSLLLYLAASLLFDGRVSFSSWIWLGLAVAILLGPFGTLLTGWLLRQVAADVRREKVRRKPAKRFGRSLKAAA